MNKTSVKLTIDATLVKAEKLREIIRWGSFLEPPESFVINCRNLSGGFAAIVTSGDGGHHVVRKLRKAVYTKEKDSGKWLLFELEEDTSSLWCWQAGGCDSIVGQFCAVTDFHLTMTPEMSSASITIDTLEKVKAFWTQPTTLESIVKKISAKCFSQFDKSETWMKLNACSQVANWAIENIHQNGGSWQLNFDTTGRNSISAPNPGNEMVLEVSTAPMSAKGFPAMARHICLGGNGNWSLTAVWAHAEETTEHTCVPDCQTGTFVYNLTSGETEILKEQDYVALSYVWRHYDSMGLKRLLNKMAASGLWKYVWVDRLCIDQACLKHKQDQVPKMGKIYTEAEEVIVLMEDLGAEDSTIFVRQETEVIQQRYFLRDFYRHEWHSRVWTWQEALLAKELSFAIGGSLVDRRRIHAMAIERESTFGNWGSGDTHIVYHTDEHGKIALAFIREGKLLICDTGLGLQETNLLLAGNIEGGSNEPQMTLWDAWKALRWRHCGREEDRFYGTLGLLKPIPDLEIEYGKGIDEVMHKAIQKGMASADFLASVEPSSNPEGCWKAPWHAQNPGKEIGFFGTEQWDECKELRLGEQGMLVDVVELGKVFGKSATYHSLDGGKREMHRATVKRGRLQLRTVFHCVGCFEELKGGTVMALVPKHHSVADSQALLGIVADEQQDGTWRRRKSILVTEFERHLSYEERTIVLA